MSWVQTVLIGSSPKRTLVRLLIVVVLLVCLRAFVLLPVRVQNISMLPAHPEGAVNFVYRLAYLFSNPKPGDIVTIRFSGNSIMYMKRVVGVPGDTIAFESGRLLVDGEAVDEPYLKLPSDWNRPPVVLGPTQYFVVGDNRSMPQENHEFGRVERERIVGKVILCESFSVSW